MREAEPEAASEGPRRGAVGSASATGAVPADKFARRRERGQGAWEAGGGSAPPAAERSCGVLRTLELWGRSVLAPPSPATATLACQAESGVPSAMSSTSLGSARSPEPVSPSPHYSDLASALIAHQSAGALDLLHAEKRRCSEFRTSLPGLARHQV